MNFATMLRQMREAVERRLPGQCPTLTVVPRKGLDELLRDYDRIDGLARGAHYSDEQLRARIRELEAQIAEQENILNEFCETIQKNALQLKKHGNKRREWRKLERAMMCRIMDLITDDERGE